MCHGAHVEVGDSLRELFFSYYVGWRAQTLVINLSGPLSLSHPVGSGKRTINNILNLFVYLLYIPYICSLKRARNKEYSLDLGMTSKYNFSLKEAKTW